MELIQTFMNLVVPPIGLTTLFFFLPAYLFFKFVFSTFRYIFSENVAGKVVLITGASSGIGEHLAYEYAMKGACLALVARRNNRLREVASLALELGSPDVMVIQADVSKVADCERFVNQTVEHFGRLDHLVNNAGVTPMCMFEDYNDITKSTPVMDINFWGSVYTSYFAIPHLKNSNGRIVGIASSAGWLRAVRMSFYSASKAAIISFYETLRVELGSEIGITIVNPGLVESEMTQGKFLSKDGIMVLDQEMRDVEINLLPVASVRRTAKAIVNGVCRGDRYVTEPAWMRMTFFWTFFCPEILDWANRLFLVTGNEAPPLGKLILDFTGAKKLLYPESILSPQLKKN